MKRILSVLAIAAAVSLAASAGAQPAKAVAKHAAVAHARLAASQACPVSDPSLCSPSCRRGQAMSAAFAANAARIAVVPAAHAAAMAPRSAMNGRACPVSDPSKCLASCQRQSATAVAAKTTDK